MEDASIVPDHHVANGPVVADHPLGPGGSLQQSLEEIATSSTSMPTTWSAVAPRTSDLRPDRCFQTRGCSRPGPLCASRPLARESGSRRRRASSPPASARAHPGDLLLFLVGQVVVGQIGAGERRSTVSRRDDPRARGSRPCRGCRRRPVDVPLGVALEVLGQVVVGTLGDHGDLGYRMVRPGDELTEASPEGHLLIIVDPDITEQQHTVVLQRVQEAVRHWRGRAAGDPCPRRAPRHRPSCSASSSRSHQPYDNPIGPIGTMPVPDRRDRGPRRDKHASAAMQSQSI